MSKIRQLYKKYGSPRLAIDYLKARDLAIDEMVAQGGFNSLSVEDKYYIIFFYAEDPAMTSDDNNTAKVTFLMGEGFTQAEALSYLTESYSKHHLKERESCLKRANSKKGTSIMATYLNIVDLADFINTTKTMFDNYKFEGIKGTAYGKAGEGIMDFIESTPGTSFENIGLKDQGYVLKQGTITDLITELKSLLVDGNYTE